MYRNIDEINQALGMTGSNYRVPGPGPTQAERGAQNQADAMAKAGAVVNAFMGNYAGAAAALQGQRKAAAERDTTERDTQAVQRYPGMAGGGYADPSIAGSAPKQGGGFDAQALFGKLFGGGGGFGGMMG